MNSTVATTEIFYSGLDALLTPEESVLLFVGHQAFQFANLHSYEPQLVVNDVVALAKTTKLFGGPNSDDAGPAIRFGEGNQMMIAAVDAMHKRNAVAQPIGQAQSEKAFVERNTRRRIPLMVEGFFLPLYVSI
jgi:hypothetical protein